MIRRTGTLMFLGFLAGACDGDSVAPPVIEGKGTVGGVVYLDFDGSGALNGPDQAMEGIGVRVTLPGSGQVVAADTSDGGGEFLMEGIPAGTIEVGADPASLGDTLLVVPQDSTRYTLRAGAVVVVALGVTYPELSLTEVRLAEPGIPVFTQGVVLNSRGQAPGGAVHVEGDGVALRVLVPPAVQVLVGDSVRIFGRVTEDLGQPALAEGRMLRVVPGARDATYRTPTMGEAKAGADNLDAALVEFTEVTVLNQTTVPEGVHLTVTDGADTLLVRLRTEQGSFQPDIPKKPLTIIRLRGLLLPDPATGEWALVPRIPDDVRWG